MHVALALERELVLEDFAKISSTSSPSAGNQLRVRANRPKTPPEVGTAGHHGSMSAKTWVSAMGVLAAGVAATAITAQSAAAQSNGFQCPPSNGQFIVINAGDIDCVTASDFAVQYDLNGDKFQQIGPFTCYFGNAMTAPLLFTCVADTADHAEFAVYPA